MGSLSKSTSKASATEIGRELGLADKDLEGVLTALAQDIENQTKNLDKMIFSSGEIKLDWALLNDRIYPLMVEHYERDFAQENIHFCRDVLLKMSFEDLYEKYNLSKGVGAIVNFNDGNLFDQWKKAMNPQESQESAGDDRDESKLTLSFAKITGSSGKKMSREEIIKTSLKKVKRMVREDAGRWTNFKKLKLPEINAEMMESIKSVEIRCKGLRRLLNNKRDDSTERTAPKKIRSLFLTADENLEALESRIAEFKK